MEVTRTLEEINNSHMGADTLAFTVEIRPIFISTRFYAGSFQRERNNTDSR